MNIRPRDNALARLLPVLWIFRRAVAWSVILVMLFIAAVTQVVGAPQAAAAPKGKDPRTMPLMLSKAKSKPEKQPPVQEADFAPLLASSDKPSGKSSFDPKTSKETGRSENSIEFTNANGTKTLVLSRDPLGIPDGKGGWAPIDTRLVDKKDSKRVTAARTETGVELAEFANDPALFKVNQGGIPVTVKLDGAGKAGRRVDGSKAAYANALPNTDLTYEVTADSVKESIVLKNKSAVGEGRWVFTLDTGDLTPKVDGKVVKITDKAGKLVAALPPIEVWDSAGNLSDQKVKDKDRKGPATTGGSYEVKRIGDSWQLTVSVDKKWLSDKARKFPIVVDPTYTWGFGQQSEAVTYNQGGLPCSFSCGIRTGNARNFIGQNAFWRTAVRYDLTPLAGKTVTSARVDLKLASTAAEQKPASEVKLFEATTPRSFTAIGTQLASASIGENGSLSSAALATTVGGRAGAADKNLWVMLGGAETNTYSYKQLQAALVVDYTDDGGTTPPPAGPQVNPVGPIEDAVIATDMPTLEVSAGPSGTKYCFKISTGFDGRSGSVVDSGCLSTPKWTVPKDVLYDGARYTWTVATVASGSSTPSPQNWVRHFKLDKRIGNAGPAPTDEFGPVKVNLFNGNVMTSAAGPVFEALGGSAGVTFAYNSRQNGDSHGVRASYFNDADHNGAADATPVMVRSEAQVNLDWGNVWSNVSENLPWKEDPMPTALDKQWFVIRWEGYFQAPVTGDYSFAGSHADGAKIWLNNALVYDKPNKSAVDSTFSSATAKQATDVSLSAGERVPLKVELYHSSTEKPQMVLWAKSTTGASSSRSINWNPRIVTSEWLFAQDPSPLPGGWTLGLMGSQYVSADVLDGSVVLTDLSGGKHGWTKVSQGGYAPPAGEDGVLAIDPGGRVSHTVNGVVSVFNVDGTLAAVSKVDDSKKPASLQYLYSGSPARLTQIKDPVSGRAHTLYYNTDNSNNCYGGATFPTGAHSAQPQKLCRVKYWDGTETRLWYIAGALTRIENPGSEIADYSYLNLEAAKLEYEQAGNNTEKKLKAINSVGLLNEIRDSLAVDLRAIGAIVPGYERTQIEYEAFYDDTTATRPPHSRPITVTGPTHHGRDMASRPSHSYRYDIANKKAIVDIASLNTNGDLTVTWDDAGRQLTATNAVGDTTRSEWNAKDHPTAVVDATGRRKTVLYDHADRPTDQFGPAPADCFNGLVPTASCAATIPHNHLGYDENIVGLEVAYYDNPYLVGVPKEWATGVGTQDGSLSKNWGASPPVANTGGWSARMTGEIELPQAGDYKLGFTAVDGVRLWIDENLILDSWTDKPSTATSGTYSNANAGSRHKVRIDYYNRAGNTGALELTWTPPGSGSTATVPGASLAPRYKLETSNVSYNTSGGETERAPGTVTATEYADPANGIDPVFGLATAKIGDPGGLNLTSRKRFEKPGEGFLRQLEATLPAGDLGNPDTRGASVYYGDSETRANPCDSNSTAVHQGGRVKTVQSAKTSDDIVNVLETVYNAAGRIVAMRANSEPWSCQTYDSRGRTLTKSFPAMDGLPARTITHDYAVDGDPRNTKISDNSGSTQATINLHHQVVSFTDTTGAVTTSTYDLAGRKTSQASTIKGVTSTLKSTWDDASRLIRLELDGTAVATPTYQGGEVRTVGYGNSTGLTITRNHTGYPTALAWTAGGTTVTSSVSRSRDQRITDELVADTANGGAEFNYSYAYDAVGRLIAANVPFHQMTYGFSATNGCGTNPRAGLNTNRTSYTDSHAGATPVVTNYCYDNADRLLSTNGGTNLSFTYDKYGNAIKVGSDTLAYDSTRRHISTTTAAGRSVTYTRDVSDRIIARTVQEGGNPAQVTKYGFTDSTGAPDFVLDSQGGLRQRLVTLPGGVVLTKNYTSGNASNWAYPNVHGSILFTSNGSGARTGSLHLYDPYGQNIDPTTGSISDISIPATAEGGMDFGWLGQHKIPIEHVGSQQALEMGARTYLPVLGRFLQSDPIQGGSANAYEYGSGDPVNNYDLTGMYSKPYCMCSGAGTGIGGGPGDFGGAVPNGLDAGYRPPVGGALGKPTGPRVDGGTGGSGAGAMNGTKPQAENTGPTAPGNVKNPSPQVGGKPSGRAPELPSGKIPESKAMDAAEKWLGPGYVDKGGGRYVSADGQRQVRYGEHETVKSPTHHMHFESYENGRVAENAVVEIIPG
ncbi:PA14 domain-containing protein [Nocardia asteroides]|uniref:PA14 domain-containing protein n=1 Tax=Nocardia asteroides TaxID=1824 RepID=UPI0037C883ED